MDVPFHIIWEKAAILGKGRYVVLNNKRAVNMWRFQRRHYFLSSGNSVLSKSSINMFPCMQYEHFEDSLLLVFS